MAASDRNLGYAVIALFFFLTGISVWYYIRISYFPEDRRVIQFSTVGNLKIDDDVRMNGGMLIGRVEDIVWHKRGVFVTIKTSLRLSIHSQNRITCSTRGLMGERAVYIDPGPDSTRLLSSRDTLAGSFIPGIAEVLRAVPALHDSIQSLQRLTQSIIHKPDNPDSLSTRFAEFMDSVDAVTLTMRRMAMAVEKELPRLVDSLHHLSSFAGTIRDTLATAIPAGVHTLHNIVGSLKRTLAAIDTLTVQTSGIIDELNTGDGVFGGERLGSLVDALQKLGTLLDRLQKNGLAFKVRFVRDEE